MTFRQPERAAFSEIIHVDDIPGLGEEEVHLWLLPLNQPSNILDALATNYGDAFMGHGGFTRIYPR